LRYFWKGEVPPEDMLEMKLRDSSKKKTSGEASKDSSADKNTRGESSRQGKPETISLISDSEDEQISSRAKKSMATRTIKAEPAESQTVDLTVPSLPTPRRSSSIISEQSPAKRIKLEPASENFAQTQNPSRKGDDGQTAASDELQRLKRENEEIEEELATNQRILATNQTIAALLREKRVKKARIAAMEGERSV
jgi:hypothetical protein